MKIVAGLGSLKDYDAYVGAGADELFCGVMPFEWLEKYGVMAPLNRREVLLYPAQIATMADMRILARLSAADGVPVAVTFNAASYAPEQYPLITRLMEELLAMGIDRFILADQALMLRAPAGCRIHVSGEWGEFSRASMQALRDVRPARLIFHRKVSVGEMIACREALPGLEYEAFMLNERCHYTGAMCHSLHCDELPHLCRVPWRMGGVDRPLPSGEIPPPDRDAPDSPDSDRPGATGCGLCALGALERAGVTHLKLVGRGNHPARMARDIAFLKRALACEGDVRQTLFPDGCSGVCYFPGYS